MQKDYWNISKRNFRALGIICAIFTVLYVLVAQDNPTISQIASFTTAIVSFITAVLLFVIASLFKKHSQKAIIVSYVYLGLVFIYDIVSGLITGSILSGLDYKILGLLVLAYLLDNIYKASKQINPISQ